LLLAKQYYNLKEPYYEGFIFGALIKGAIFRKWVLKIDLHEGV
jgi:hypothetical protein